MNSSALNKYDRQIRTIGIEMQHQYDVLKQTFRLFRSNVLVIGSINHLTSELIKNVVLLGVGRVELFLTEGEPQRSIFYTNGI